MLLNARAIGGRGECRLSESLRSGNNLNCDWIAEQCLIYRDGLVDHRLDCCRVRVVEDRTVERWVDDKPGSSPPPSWLSLRLKPLLVPSEL